MSKQTGNLVKRRKVRHILNPPIAVKPLIAQFQKNPGYAMARLKRADSKRLTALALILGKQYKQLPDGDETRRAIATIIIWIQNLVAERRKQDGNTTTRPST